MEATATRITEVILSNLTVISTIIRHLAEMV